MTKDKTVYCGAYYEKGGRRMTTKDEIKNRISMALRDPVLQQGFEIICRENAELETQIEKIKSDIEKLKDGALRDGEWAILDVLDVLYNHNFEITKEIKENEGK